MKAIYTLFTTAMIASLLSACSPATTPSTPATPSPSASATPAAPLNAQSFLDAQKNTCVKELQEGENALSKEQATTICDCSITNIKAAIDKDASLMSDEKRLEEVSTAAAAACSIDSMMSSN